MKICGNCKIKKDNSEFGKSKQTLDGLRWECKECRKKNYYSNHEKMLKEKRQDYQKHKESRLLKDKQKYNQNKEYIKQQRKEHYWSNRKKVLEQQKRYKENNKEEFLKNRREREQKQRNEIKQQKLQEQLLLESQIITIKYPDTHKQCSKCHALKEINTENFNLIKNKKVGDKIVYRAFCKECQSKDHKIYHEENGDELRAKQRKYCRENPEKMRERHRKHRETESFKIRFALPKNRIIRNMTQYIRFALSQEGLKKDGRATMKYVGCTREFFRNYIQSQWKEGMCWENYGNGPGEWSVDHFIPKEAFNLLNQEEQDICFNYKNCQPMWHLENEAKQDKMPDGSFARETKDNYSLNDKINLIENRAQSLNLLNL